MKVVNKKKGTIKNVDIVSVANKAFADSKKAIRGQGVANTSDSKSTAPAASKVQGIQAGYTGPKQPNLPSA